jgi:translation initiation factor IF-3
VQAAKKQGLDLVLIAPNSNPPVAKILDFSKFLYEEKKKKSGSKGKKSELKELKFGPNTGEGDILRYIDRAKEFIGDANRVKVNVIMRGRQQMYPELAFEKLDRIIGELSEIAKSEAEPKRQGNSVFVILVPK